MLQPTLWAPLRHGITRGCRDLVQPHAVQTCFGHRNNQAVSINRRQQVVDILVDLEHTSRPDSVRSSPSARWPLGRAPHTGLL